MRILLLPILCICALLPRPALAQNDVVKDAGSSDFNRNKPERVEWFRQAGSGLFIHFGVDAQLGVVISHSLVGASDEYVQRYFSQLPKTFDPYRFNPRELAVLARLAGMKYVMFTTKHHSGFCLWDTKTTAFNCMNTPYHRDMVKEYVEAVRAEGLEVGFYFSPEDFHFLHEHCLPIQRGTIEMDAATRAEYDDYTRRQCVVHRRRAEGGREAHVLATSAGPADHPGRHENTRAGIARRNGQRSLAILYHHGDGLAVPADQRTV
jgi:alpha-L-fucosidase